MWKGTHRAKEACLRWGNGTGGWSSPWEAGAEDMEFTVLFSLFAYVSQFP